MQKTLDWKYKGCDKGSYPTRGQFFTILFLAAVALTLFKVTVHIFTICNALQCHLI